MPFVPFITKSHDLNPTSNKRQSVYPISSPLNSTPRAHTSTRTYRYLMHAPSQVAVVDLSSSSRTPTDWSAQANHLATLLPFPQPNLPAGAEPRLLTSLNRLQLFYPWMAIRFRTQSCTPSRICFQVDFRVPISKSIRAAQSRLSDSPHSHHSLTSLLRNPIGMTD